MTCVIRTERILQAEAIWQVDAKPGGVSIVQRIPNHISIGRTSRRHGWIAREELCGRRVVVSGAEVVEPRVGVLTQQTGGYEGSVIRILALSIARSMSSGR